ncbi:Putative 2-hydroxyacid dehydrogenase [Cladobotryum mycophilum]|uniref:2-hydroxyacid dehydrogenase n=1 Tax=Cladobotryum mycophilum TaxID=491253 RepID=A0ABR0SX68_9HYPO
MTLGVVGMGSIGRYLARKASVFNMRVKYHNRRRLSNEAEAQCSNATYCDSLHDLLSQSDVVSINCPLTAETTNLISSDEFAAMRDGAFLINTSRGPVVNEEALIAALESGKITRAGLDVFNNEPDINDYFKKSDKVVIQPHVGGWTEEAIKRAERECLENVKALFKTGRPVAPVNSL